MALRMDGGRGPLEDTPRFPLGRTPFMEKGRVGSAYPPRLGVA